MIKDQIETFAKLISKIQFHTLVITQEQGQPVDLFFYILTFGCLLPFIVVVPVPMSDLLPARLHQKDSTGQRYLSVFHWKYQKVSS